MFKAATPEELELWVQAKPYRQRMVHNMCGCTARSRGPCTRMHPHAEVFATQQLHERMCVQAIRRFAIVDELTRGNTMARGTTMGVGKKSPHQACRSPHQRGAHEPSV